MALPFIGATSNLMTVAPPAGTRAGDLLLLYNGNGPQTNGTSSPIAGWTSLARNLLTIGGAPAEGYARIADGTAGDTVTVGSAGFLGFGLSMAAYRLPYPAAHSANYGGQAGAYATAASLPSLALPGSVLVVAMLSETIQAPNPETPPQTPAGFTQDAMIELVNPTNMFLAGQTSDNYVSWVRSSANVSGSITVTFPFGGTCDINQSAWGFAVAQRYGGGLAMLL